MTLPSQIAADVAARIAQADDEAAAGAAAFAAGRFPQLWALRAQQLLKRIEAAGEVAIANTANRGEDR